jgi:hypothetical protein
VLEDVVADELFDGFFEKIREKNSLLKSASSHIAVWELAYLEVEPLFSLAVCYDRTEV